MLHLYGYIQLLEKVFILKKNQLLGGIEMKNTNQFGNTFSVSQMYVPNTFGEWLREPFCCFPLLAADARALSPLAGRGGVGAEGFPAAQRLRLRELLSAQDEAQGALATLQSAAGSKGKH